MRRLFYSIIIMLLCFTGCVPLDYVEPSGKAQSEYNRDSGSREFYHQSMNQPIVVEYQNGTSKGKILYEIDDPYVDINMVGSASRTSEIPADYYSIDQINDCFKFYITAQKAVVDDDLDLANRSINKALEILEIKSFYDLKGSIYYLGGDTVKANYYWNYLNLE
jgi:hypothetical protein